MVLLLIAVSIISFFLIVNAPIDPLTSYVGPESTLSAEARQEIADYWGLYDPPVERFMTWLGNILKGEWGDSITYKKPVAEVIGVRFGYSFGLMACTWVISGVLGFVIGVLCGMREGGWFDRMMKYFCLMVKSAPTFWIGLLILVVFAVELKWFPIGMAVPLGKPASEVTFFDRLYHMALPIMTLSVISMSDIMLFTRQKLIEIINSDFILYARARGENEKQIVMRHVIRNIALPAITVQFSSFSELFGGMALAENVFSYPGIGTATTAAALNADVPLMLGIAVCSAVFVFAGNLMANILYGIFDPRIKEGVITYEHTHAHSH